MNFFEVAGKDDKWYPAKGKIKNGSVILYSSKVKEPVNVRYAWKNSIDPDLKNADGLPAS